MQSNFSLDDSRTILIGGIRLLWRRYRHLRIFSSIGTLHNRRIDEYVCYLIRCIRMSGHGYKYSSNMIQVVLSVKYPIYGELLQLTYEHLEMAPKIRICMRRMSDVHMDSTYLLYVCNTGTNHVKTAWTLYDGLGSLPVPVVDEVV